MAHVGGIDAHVKSSTNNCCFGGESTYTGVAHGVGVTLFGYVLQQVEAVVGALHCGEWHLDGVYCSSFECCFASGLFGFGFLGHLDSGHDAIERLSVFVYEMNEGILQPATLVGLVGKFFPTVVPAGFVRRKISNHSA